MLKRSEFISLLINRTHGTFSVPKRILTAFWYHFTKKKVTFVRWQLDLFGITLLIIGFILGSAISWNFIIPKIFASTTTTITKDTATDFSQGTMSSTQSVGSGASAYVALTGGNNWWNSSYTYRRQITVDITGNATLPSGYAVNATLSGSDASGIYSNSLSSGNDFRVVYFNGTTNTELDRSIVTFGSSSINFYFKTQAALSGNDTSHYFIYYGYAGAGSPPATVANIFSSNNAATTGTASASDTYTATQVSWINDGAASGLVGGWGNNNVANSRVMIKLSTARKIWKVAQYWGGDNTGGWAKPNGTYFPATFKLQYTTNSSAAASDAVASGNWTNFSVASDNLAVTRTDTVDYSPTYAGSPSVSTSTITTNSNACTNCWGTTFNQTFNPVNALSTRIEIVNTTWLGALAEFYVYTINTTDATVEPTLSVGSQTTNIASSGTWESPTDSNVIDTVWNGGWGDGSTGGSTAFSATLAALSSTETVQFSIRTAATAGALSSATYDSMGTANTGTTFTVTKSQMDALTDVQTGASGRYIQIKATIAQSSGTSPQLDSFTITYQSDNTAPESNASALAMSTSSSGRSIASNGWNNDADPYFSWTAGSDSQAGVKGYCLYLGTDSAGNPATSKGILGTSPVSTTGTTCQFIVSSTSVDLSTSGYLESALVSGTTYYLNVKVLDIANNIFAASTASFHFQHDVTAPTNLSYLSMPSQNYSNVSDMNFSWPTSGGSAASDAHSGVVGWQYQINSSSGTWQGTTHSTTLDLDYIPATASAYMLVPARDSSAIVSGNNVVYFRTVDTAGNTSSSSTYRTGNLTYGGAAPSFDGDATVTVTPSSATTNSFALSWPAATASGSNTVTHYYYMVNTSPPSTLATLQGNSSTYIDNGTTRTVSADALANVNKGSNTVYVVAIDNASTPNYSPSNAISGTFTLNSTDPDPVQSLVATDSSIKAQSQWNVTLTWTAGDYQGAGNLTYLVYRSADNATFSQVGSTSGLSYVDNTSSSAAYYYYVVTQDGADANSSNSSTVTITPTGKYTTPPTLSSGPTASLITTKGATITWSTDRAGSSAVAYGTSSGSYFTTQPSVATQVTAHSIALTNLTPGTTYYYKVNWTDADGNIGTSSESTFATSPAPKVQDVKTSRIGLSDATIQFTSVGASSVKIYYGGSTAFGAVKSISTGTGTTTYTTELSDLVDGKKYYYQINTFDADGNEYVGTILDFTTLPRPKISGVRVQQVSNTAQPTILVSWNTNTQVSSIVTYYPEGNTGAAKDEVNVALTKGEHQMLIRSLFPQTNYYLVVKGRDKAGNEASSDVQKVTTATDTRPPQVSGLKVEGSSLPTSRNSSDQQSQLAVSWNTDEPGTSQVEFGEGTGATYSQKTQEDSSLTSNHLVVISGLTPSKVYHLRVVSKDKASNIGNSIDTVTITPKATDNAFNLVVGSLGQIFGGFGK